MSLSRHVADMSLLTLRLTLNDSYSVRATYLSIYNTYDMLEYLSVLRMVTIAIDSHPWPFALNTHTIEVISGSNESH